MTAPEQSPKDPQMHRFLSATPNARVFVQRVRHNGEIRDAEPGTVLTTGDVIAVSGRREVHRSRPVQPHPLDDVGHRDRLAHGAMTMPGLEQTVPVEGL